MDIHAPSTQSATWPSNLLDLVDAAARIHQIAPERVTQLVGRFTRLGRPARRPAAVIRVLTASGGIGAPTGSRNRLTSTKSLSPAAGTLPTLKLVGVKCLHRRGNPAEPPAGGGTWPRPRSDCRGEPHADEREPPSQPSGRESSGEMDIAAAQPAKLTTAQPRPGHQQRTISRSRALRHACNKTHDLGVGGPVHLRPAGSCSRCRARNRHPILASSPRACAGRSRSSPSSYSTGSSVPAHDR